jgi:hypothetical protein
VRAAGPLTGLAVLVALTTAGAAAARPALLPSPTVPLDARVPLTGAAPAGPIQLPRNAGAANSQQVLAEVAGEGTVVRLRVLQRLTLTGLGDFFFQIPAPVRDVRALPGSQGEPGLRANAILWQGFSAGRRRLAAEAELRPSAAGALPLRVELGRGTLRLRNATSVRTLGFAASAERSAVLPVLTQIAEQAAGRSPPGRPIVQIKGPTVGRRLLVDAPLRVVGAIRVRGRLLRRFERIVGGPAPRSATIQVPTDAEVVLTVEPVPLVPELRYPPRTATGTDLLILAERSLLRLARVHQYRTFLAGPAPGPARTIYRFRTVGVQPPAAAKKGDDGSSLGLVVLLGAGMALLSAGAVVLWAHL